MDGGRFRSFAWIVALIFFLAGLNYIRPIYTPSAFAEDTVTGTSADSAVQSSDSSNDSDNSSQSDSSKIKVLGMTFKVPNLFGSHDQDNDSDNDAHDRTENDDGSDNSSGGTDVNSNGADSANGSSDDSNNGSSNTSDSSSASSSSSENQNSGGNTVANVISNAVTLLAGATVDDTLLPTTVVGSVESSTFPYSMDMGDLIIETDNLIGDNFSASQVGASSPIANLADQVLNLGRSNRSSVARMNWKWAMFNRFQMYQNYTAEGMEPCHIEIGSDEPVQVGANDVSVDTSELYASQITDGSTFTIGRYWTISPEIDLPRRHQGRNLAMLNGTNVKIKANSIKAESISIPNFSISVEPGLKMSTVN